MKITTASYVPRRCVEETTALAIAAWLSIGVPLYTIAAKGYGHLLVLLRVHMYRMSAYNSLCGHRLYTLYIIYAVV